MKRIILLLSLIFSILHGQFLKPSLTRFPGLPGTSTLNYFIANPHGSIYAIGGDIFRSDDNGVNWALVQREYGMENSLQYVTLDENGVLYGAGGKDIYRSTDGGETWSKFHQTGGKSILNIAAGPPGVVASVVSLSDTNTQILITNDNSQTWRLRTIPAPTPQIRFLTGTGILAAGHGSQKIFNARKGVYISDNYGESWSLLDLPGDSGYDQIWYGMDGTLFCKSVGENGQSTIWYSMRTNYGAWASIPEPVEFTVSKPLDYVNSTENGNFYGVRRDSIIHYNTLPGDAYTPPDTLNKIVFSSDFGVTWELASESSSLTVTDMFSRYWNRLWVLGSGRLALGRNSILLAGQYILTRIYSIQEGWSMPLFPGLAMRSILPDSSGNFYAVGDNNVAMLNKNTMTLDTIYDGWRIISASIGIDNTIGMLSESGYYEVSTDYGRNWETKPYFDVIGWYPLEPQIHVLDANRYALVADNIFSLTSDGGQTCTKKYFAADYGKVGESDSTTTFKGSYAVAHDGTVYAISGKHLLKSKNLWNAFDIVMDLPSIIVNGQTKYFNKIAVGSSPNRVVLYGLETSFPTLMITTDGFESTTTVDVPPPSYGYLFTPVVLAYLTFTNQIVIKSHTELCIGALGRKEWDRYNTSGVVVTQLHELDDEKLIILGDGKMYTMAMPKFSAGRSERILSIVHSYPNPFNISINIRFHMQNAAELSVSIYDIRGRFVCNLLNGSYGATTVEATWRPSTMTASGIYFAVIKADGEITASKLVYLK